MASRVQHALSKATVHFVNFILIREFSASFLFCFRPIEARAAQTALLHHSCAATTFGQENK